MSVTVGEVSGGEIAESKEMYIQYFDSYFPPKNSNNIKNVPRKAVITKL